MGKGETYLSPKHAQNLAALVVDDRLRFLVVQHGHGEAALVVGVHAKVDVAQVREALVASDGVGHHVLARRVGVLGRDEAPTWGSCQMGFGI